MKLRLCLVALLVMLVMLMGIAVAEDAAVASPFAKVPEGRIDVKLPAGILKGVLG